MRHENVYSTIFGGCLFVWHLKMSTFALFVLISGANNINGLVQIYTFWNSPSFTRADRVPNISRVLVDWVRTIIQQGLIRKSIPVGIGQEGLTLLKSIVPCGWWEIGMLLLFHRMIDFSADLFSVPRLSMWNLPQNPSQRSLVERMCRQTAEEETWVGISFIFW